MFDTPQTTIHLEPSTSVVQQATKSMFLTWVQQVNLDRGVTRDGNPVVGASYCQLVVVPRLADLRTMRNDLATVRIRPSFLYHRV